jgi:hypothetical protein
VRSAIAAVIVFAWVALVSPTLVAQWPSYPSKNVPRTADGKPNLAAPAPRTADGVPDLSGIWNYAGVLGFRGGPPPPPPGTPVQATFWNIEAGFKEGLPFTPWGAELRRKRMADNSKDNPDAACLPLGHMQLHTHSQPRKMIQTTDVIVIIYEANANVRQIFLDGRPATRAAGGKATRSSSRRPTSAMKDGSMSTARRSQRRGSSPSGSDVRRSARSRST